MPRTASNSWVFHASSPLSVSSTRWGLVAVAAVSSLTVLVSRLSLLVRFRRRSD